MKRFFTFLTMVGLMLALSQPVVAQEQGRWQVKGGVGWFSLPDVFGSLVAGLGSIDTTEGVEHKGFAPMLNPNVEVYCGINDWFALGGSLALGYMSFGSKFVETGALSKSSTALYPTLCIGAQTRYFSTGKFSMYGSWGAGVMALISNQKTPEENNIQVGVIPMVNLYPLSLSYGGSTGGFLEAGWGAKGFVNVGVYHNF